MQASENPGAFVRPDQFLSIFVRHKYKVVLFWVQMTPIELQKVTMNCKRP